MINIYYFDMETNYQLIYDHFFLFLSYTILASMLSMSISPTYWAAFSISLLVYSFPILSKYFLRIPTTISRYDLFSRAIFKAFSHL